MQFLTLLALFFGTMAIAADGVSLSNDREGVSVYTSKSVTKSINNLLKNVSAAEIKDAFKSSIKDVPEGRLCSFDINEKIRKSLPRGSDYKAVVHYLRLQNEIDDSIVRILIRAHEAETMKLPEQEEERSHWLPEDETKALEMSAAVENFEKKYLSVSCFDEAYKSLHSELMKVDKKIKDSQIEAIYHKALVDKKISQALYLRLERARLSEVQKWALSLKDYAKKIRSLRNQYPLRDSNEKSNFISVEVKKIDLSRRQKLLENYTDLQIVVMANVIKKLRTRLDSERMEILVYAPEELEPEVIPLNPMDRFCFCVVKLRDEMAQLRLNTYFNGRSPDYVDLVTAAFEIGLIPATELDTVGNMEEIWNPKKTFWDKAKVWVTTIGSVASIVVPPPYGFIPALAMVAIQATTTDTDAAASDPTRLFKCKN